jgi:uncharacterized protein (DUF697 family)
MWWSMGAGLIPFPLIDLVAISGVQLKMLAQLSKIYGIEFHENTGKALVGSLLGYLVPKGLAGGTLGSLLKSIPVVGPIMGLPSLVIFCGASTYALGRVFVQHFAAGGTFLTFDPSKVKEYFEREYQEGCKLAETMNAEKKADVPA